MRNIVIVESPYAGNIERNVAYARLALRDCLDRGESPFASHLLYTQVGVLDDSNPVQRERGIEAGLSFYQAATLCVVYNDLGISDGMKRGAARAAEHGVEIVFRKIPEFDLEIEMQITVDRIEDSSRSVRRAYHHGGYVEHFSATDRGPLAHVDDILVGDQTTPKVRYEESGRTIARYLREQKRKAEAGEPFTTFDGEGSPERLKALSEATRGMPTAPYIVARSYEDRWPWFVRFVRRLLGIEGMWRDEQADYEKAVRLRNEEAATQASGLRPTTGDQARPARAD